ncbi:hypothetical protein BQ1740_2588 [Bacillus subtilis]|nr:hypothetical protein BQ1740_2588 [Bacillus subtilis]
MRLIWLYCKNPFTPQSMFFKEEKIHLILKTELKKKLINVDLTILGFFC